MKRNVNHYLGIKYDPNAKKWINDTTKTPSKYINFHPNVVKKENENCAIFNLNAKYMDNNTHFPGYWFYRNCNASRNNIICHIRREKSK